MASIQLQQWQPDAPHARRLREAEARVDNAIAQALAAEAELDLRQQVLAEIANGPTPALLQRAALALLSGEGEGMTGRALRNLGLDELSLDLERLADGANLIANTQGGTGNSTGSGRTWMKDQVCSSPP